MYPDHYTTTPQKSPVRFFLRACLRALSWIMMVSLWVILAISPLVMMLTYVVSVPTGLILIVLGVALVAGWIATMIEFEGTDTKLGKLLNLTLGLG